MACNISRRYIGWRPCGKVRLVPLRPKTLELAILGRQVCPQLGREVTQAECAGNAGEMPTSSPAALRLWRACQACPHRPEETLSITKPRSRKAAGKEQMA